MLATALAILLVGCAAGDGEWVKASVNTDTQNKDVEACRQSAEERLRVGPYAAEREQRRLEALNQRPSRQAGPDQTALRQIEIRDQLERERAFRDCMTARGYTRRT
ncbi:MAG TPA: hypothetical protein VJ924_10125 [Alphaproteobacteria bacterium]|nr:hypothetical protein [Alphaproteobacteria bacterium]